jgi:hypothetical protein
VYGKEVQIGAAPEPCEVNTCPTVPAEPVRVKPVVMLGVTRVGVVSDMLETTEFVSTVP